MKNAATWVEDCLISIQAQTFVDWELIVINDFSEDESFEIVLKFTQTDPRIRLERNEEKGIIPALRKAFKLSKGEYIHRMDADDLMPVKKLEFLMEIATTNPNIVATGKVEYFSEAPISEGYIAYQNWLNERCEKADHWQWIYRECVIASANWITHRKNVNFDSNTYPEDYDLVFDWYSKNLEVVASNEITHRWREHQKRTSRMSENYQQKAFFELKIQRFIQLELTENESVFLIGKNQKQKLSADILRKNQIETLVIDEQSFEQEKGLLKTRKALVCIFPENHTRNLLESEFKLLGLKMALDFWYV